MTFANKAEAHTQARQTVEFRQSAADYQVGIFINERSYIRSVHADKRSISLVNQNHRVGGDLFHYATDLFTRKAVASRVVGRGQKKHTWVYAVGIFNHFVNVISKGVACFVKGVHLCLTTTFARHTVVVPPRKLWNHYSVGFTCHKVVVYGSLEDFLTTIGQQHLFFWYAVDFGEFD